MSKQIDEHVLHFYDIKKLMGSGAYGHVWKAIDRKTKRPYALKKIFDAFQNSTDAQRTYRQITVLQELDHPHIIKLEKVIKAKNNRDLYLVFEFMEADLQSLVGEKVLEDIHISFIIFQLLKSIKYLHSAQLLHRDLKPSNVLINSDCEIKLCDFGLARSLTHQENEEIILSEEVATRWYRSPEMLLSSRHYSKPTDIWSIGCIIGEVLMGKPMFPGSSTLDQLERIIQFTGMPSKEGVDSLRSEVAQNLVAQLSVRKKETKEYFANCSPQVVKLVLEMLEFNPEKRITVEEALKKPFLRQFVQGESADGLLCHKMILPQIDDNIRLNIQQYRQIIYKDIERRYPEENAFRKFTKKKLWSFTNKREKSKQKVQKREKSVTTAPQKHSLVKRSSSANIFLVRAVSPYKAILQQAKQKAKAQSGGMLKKMRSKAAMTKIGKVSKDKQDCPRKH